MEKILLTRAGYEQLMRELDLLSQVERPQIVRELLEAAQEGRVERNADFQMALAQRQKLDRRIRQLQQILANAEVLVGSNVDPNQVRFNSRVRVVNNATQKEYEYRLVGPVEADASRGRISIASPLGRALMHRAPGDSVEVKTPKGSSSYRILEIHRDEI